MLSSEDTPKVVKAEDSKEEESTATFEPVVKLEEVVVKSGEEDEEVVQSLRAKLFIFGETLLDKGSGNKTWRERGIGEMKILKHREHSRLRLLMRQERTMKVICNHALDPRISLETNVSSDRSWVWSAFDYADGDLTETVFAIRFVDTDTANTFKEKFNECKKEMEAIMEKEGEDKPDTDGTADDAANALSKLTTKDEAEDSDEEDLSNLDV